MKYPFCFNKGKIQMKTCIKTSLILLILAFCILPLYPQKKGDILEISEKMFITQINDIYFNFNDYRDKTIIVEGMYTVMQSWMDESINYPAVYRLGPGCCGNDGWAGFMLQYDGEYPSYDEWIRVTGKPFLKKEKDGSVNLYLDVLSLEVKKERGKEFVNQ